MSSSFPSSDSGSLLYIALYTLLGLTGMVFTGMLIGIFSSSMRGKIIALQQENPEIIEEGHTVILGFRPGEYALLKEMIANSEDEKRTIVVVENMERQEIEQAISRNINVPKNIRLISIKADTTNPAALKCCAIRDCSAVIVNTREKGRTIKTLLALEILLANDSERPRIVASVDSHTQVFSKDMLKDNGITMLYSGDVVARLIARSTTQPGIYEALLDIIDFANYEFYFENADIVQGLPFGSVVLAGHKAIVVGLYRKGQALINPPQDTVIQKDDLLITFEEEHGNLILDNPQEKNLPEHFEPLQSEKIGEVTVFGINNSILTILHEFPDNIDKIKLIGLSAQDYKTFIPESEEFISEIITDYRNTDSDRILLDMLKNSEHICLLSDRRKKDEDADTETMLRIIRLRNLKKKNNLSFTITAEMRCESNRDLVTIEDAEDFVVATDLSSMMLAQITTDLRRAEVFTELLNEDGSEAYMKPASDYGVAGSSLTYGELQEKIYSSGSILMGLRTKDDPFKIFTDGSQTVQIGENDQLIMLCEE
jgi:Trk K+ transport system NAD-binding subunit